MINSVGKKLINILKALALPLIIYVLFRILTGGAFGTATSMISLLRTSVVPLLMGLGMSFLMQMGMWDFSAGAVVYAAAIFSAKISASLGWGIPGVCLFAILIAVALSACSGLLYRFLRVPCMVLSLGLAMIYEALPNILTTDYTGRINLLDGYLAEMPWCLLIAAGMFVIFYIINNKTSLAADIRAIGSDIAIANSAGVNIDRVKFVSFLITGIFLGVTAVVYISVNVSVIAVTGFSSATMIFDAMMGIFVAAVISRYVDYCFAVVIGIITIRMLSSALVAMGMSSPMRGVMTGVFMFLVLMYSANSGIFDEIKNRKRIAAEANREYEQAK